MDDRPHVTLEDVAREAQVSLATASRALNGTTKVRSDLRERVLAAANQLAYTPNAHAQALAGGAHRTVGVICHDVSDPYFAGISRGVMRAADEAGLLVMLASTFRDPQKEIAYISMLRAQRASAILLVGSGFEDREWERALAAEIEPYQRGGGQVAVVSRHRTLRVDSVQPENREGAAQLARTLTAQGHRRFAVLAGPRALTTVVDRLRGFREGLAEAGVELAESHIVEASFTRDGGHAAMSELLARGLDATCVFAVTDVMAMGALAALREAGKSVPEDVSLAGFDDIPVVRDLAPPLTTVALPLEELGEKVMELAVRDNRGKRSRILRMPGTVVVRESTRAPTAP
ncbi:MULTISPECIES: LacI family DNA-binding transcriptional regulator [Prauserella salsuginis group]|uniref:LacI family transcriptional regulator n=2 Tax=Prauserella salsuginis group TaxID=2893672 RepID=A0A839XT28_9PSEU|nr:MULTISPECIES: LacI family DNA-binding transcriptional regulator [Prauserella salsuginis group]MBB3664158.1 LacI family transcriptional regulator [Prauserella sediminis]MCR3721610.1 transcriptional regulator, LacI family [Prauserella flava]MCR3734302.1 transcriptional regulator, LacI family [Prauserella salsuginis]